MTFTGIIRNGLVHDGLGSEPRHADVGIVADRIAVIDHIPSDADVDPTGFQIDATGLVVAPGFINVLSHAWQSIQLDGACESDLLQGVTTEVFGEAESLGPSSPALLELMTTSGAVEGVTLDFPRLSDGLNYVERLGISVNIASFIGGHNLRALGAGLENRTLTDSELSALCKLVDEEMAAGALGIGTALIYAPGSYATTDELVRLCEVVGRHDGLYISHMRSEGDQFLECLDELIGIGSRAGCRVQAYHLKAGGTHNHHKMALAVERIARARRSGQRVSADMYPYTAASTALAAAIPPRHHAGGMTRLIALLQEPRRRDEITAELESANGDFENLFLGAGLGHGIMLLSDLPDGTAAAGKYLPEVAALLGTGSLASALIEIVLRDPTMMATYFVMSEENVELGLSQPWVSICSDAEANGAAQSDDGFTHPRGYGSFARVLGHYCRDRDLFPLAEAIRRMTSLPAKTLRLVDRGRVQAGSFADLCIFDPELIADRATFEAPRQFAVGMHHVIVNGIPVVSEGQVLSSRPGRRLRRGI